MSLGEVLTLLQQGALDGSMATIGVLSSMRYFDVSKYALETNHVIIEHCINA